MKRTVMYMCGVKYYVYRDSRGRFVDIQSYKRAHGSDIKRRSKAEKSKGRKRKTHQNGGSERQNTDRRSFHSASSTLHREKEVS